MSPERNFRDIHVRGPVTIMDAQGRSFEPNLDPNRVDYITTEGVEVYLERPAKGTRGGQKTRFVDRDGNQQRRPWAVKFDEKARAQHRKDEARALREFKAACREAAKWDYPTAKNHHFCLRRSRSATTDRRGVLMTATQAAVVTDRNANALAEAFTAVELVRAAGIATATIAREALRASKTPKGRKLRVPTVGVRDDAAEGRVVMLAGLALTEDLVVDPDVPGELTGALVALLGEVRIRAAHRTIEHLGRVKGAMANPTKRSSR